MIERKLKEQEHQNISSGIEQFELFRAATKNGLLASPQ